MKANVAKRFYGLVILFSFISFFTHAEDVIENGTFSAGINDWKIPARLGLWNPLVTVGGSQMVQLFPPDSTGQGYYGTVIYQNMNVSGVSGKSADLSMQLEALAEPLASPA